MSEPVWAHTQFVHREVLRWRLYDIRGAQEQQAQVFVQSCLSTRRGKTSLPSPVQRLSVSFSCGGGVIIRGLCAPNIIQQRTAHDLREGRCRRRDTGRMIDRPCQNKPLFGRLEGKRGRQQPRILKKKNNRRHACTALQPK